MNNASKKGITKASPRHVQHPSSQHGFRQKRNESLAVRRSRLRFPAFSCWVLDASATSTSIESSTRRLRHNASKRKRVPLRTVHRPERNETTTTSRFRFDIAFHRWEIRRAFRSSSEIEKKKERVSLHCKLPYFRCTSVRQIVSRGECRVTERAQMPTLVHARYDRP